MLTRERRAAGRRRLRERHDRRRAAGVWRVCETQPRDAGLDDTTLAQCIARYLRPEPRVRLGRVLGRNRAASACMDLSDGLADAVHQPATASRVGMTIDADALPIEPAARAWFERDGNDPVDAAITGGDDYELVFTVRPRLRRPAADGRPPEPIRSLTRIGVCTAQALTSLLRRGDRDRRADAARVRSLPMIRATRAMVRRWLETLLHIDDTPERTAAAYALGVFFGFSPFLGFHTILGIALAFLLNLNRVAVLLGVYSNLPWIIGRLLHVHHDARRRDLTRTRLPARLPPAARSISSSSRSRTGRSGSASGRCCSPLLWPYTVGSLIGAVGARRSSPIRWRSPSSARDAGTSISTNAETAEFRMQNSAVAGRTAEALACSRAPARATSPSIGTATPGRRPSRIALMLAGSLWRKALVTLVAVGAFVWLYEATMLDSLYVSRLRGVTEADPASAEPAAPASQLAFTATAYCKGQITSAGVAPRRGVAAADPGAAAARLGRRRSTRATPGSTASTPSSTPGPRSRDGASTSTCGAATTRCRSAGRSVRLTVLRLGWNPRATTQVVHGPAVQAPRPNRDRNPEPADTLAGER